MVSFEHWEPKALRVKIIFDAIHAPSVIVRFYDCDIQSKESSSRLAWSSSLYRILFVCFWWWRFIAFLDGQSPVNQSICILFVTNSSVFNIASGQTNLNPSTASTTILGKQFQQISTITHLRSAQMFRSKCIQKWHWVAWCHWSSWTWSWSAFDARRKFSKSPLVLDRNAWKTIWLRSG